MKKYFVIIYYIPTDFVSSSAFDTKDEALRFISDNYFIDKKYKDEKNWFYKLIEVEFSIFGGNENVKK